MSQNKGTNVELKRNIIVSYSITPKLCLKKFLNIKSYIIKVIKAVVKKSPKQYFKQK
jgi:hypothetical protein